MLEVFITEGTHDGLAQRARAAGARVTMVSKHVEKTLAATVTPQGSVAVARLDQRLLRDIPTRAGLALVLAEVRDPGNAGTLLRSAAAAGADAVIFTSGSVDPFGSKTVRAAAGATFRIPIVTDLSLADAVEGLHARGFRVLGTSARSSQPVFDVDLTRHVAVVVGNESWGLSASSDGALDDEIGRAHV